MRSPSFTSFSLFALLPALTFALFLPFPVHNTTSDDIKISHDEVCTFIKFVDTDLCDSRTSVDANVSANVGAMVGVGAGVNHIKKEVILNTNYFHYTNQKFDPKELCPLFDFLNKTLCSKLHDGVHIVDETNIFNNKDKEIDIRIVKTTFEDIKNKLKMNITIDPKDICPLVDLICKTLCNSDNSSDEFDPKILCPLLIELDSKLCS